MSQEPGVRAERKKKQLLTVIPDDDRPISYRFAVCVVGKSCKDFVHTATCSEIAQEYHPGHKKDKGGEDDGAGDPGSPPFSPAAEEDDKLVLFCPVSGVLTKELARLRFSLCAGFSDSIPMTSDKSVATNTVVVFLFWRVSDAPDRREDQATLSDTISDWRSRMAEINFKPANLRPFVAVLGFKASQEQQEAVEAFASDQRKTARIVPSFFDDDSEEMFVEAMQNVVEQLISFQQSASSRRMGSTGSATPGMPGEARKGCCAVS